MQQYLKLCGDRASRRRDGGCMLSSVLRCVSPSAGCPADPASFKLPQQQRIADHQPRPRPLVC